MLRGHHLLAIFALSGIGVTHETRADELATTIQEVQRLELLGENAQRQAAIEALRESNSPSRLAHWLSGEVKVGEEWVPYSQVADHGEHGGEPDENPRDSSQDRQAVRQDD